jgi:hypothetical protein
MEKAAGKSSWEKQPLPHPGKLWIENSQPAMGDSFLWQL